MCPNMDKSPSPERGAKGFDYDVKLYPFTMLHYGYLAIHFRDTLQRVILLLVSKLKRKKNLKKKKPKKTTVVVVVVVDKVSEAVSFIFLKAFKTHLFFSWYLNFLCIVFLYVFSPVNGSSMNNGT